MVTSEIFGVIFAVLSLAGMAFYFYEVIKKDILEFARYKYTRRILGLLLIALGIAGIFFPIFPGFIFILWGASLLGNKYAKNLTERIKGYFKSRKERTKKKLKA